MKLSRTVLYALQATLHLAQADSNSPIPCSQLATQGEMPERFLLQILRNLVTKDILRSTRGAEGGYALVRRPDEITLLDIIEAIDGPLDAPSNLGDHLPNMAKKRVIDAIAAANDELRRNLRQVRLADLIG